MLTMLAASAPGSVLVLGYVLTVIAIVIGMMFEWGRERPVRRVDLPVSLAGHPVDVSGNPGSIVVGNGTRLALKVRRCCGGTLSIVSHGRAVRNLFGSLPVDIGAPEFVVHAAPRKYALWLFDPSRRADVISTLRRLARHGDVEIRISVGEVEIRVDNLLLTRSDQRALLDAARELVGHVTTAPRAGVAWVEAPVHGMCPVCATELVEPAWRCDRCGVPQHRECRDYIGRCAIYGCEPERRRRTA